MNGPLRQGMLPPTGIGPQQNMLSISNPPFMQNSNHLAQQTLGPNPLGMPQNMPSNPPMGMLSGGPVGTGAGPRYTMQANPMQQPPQQLQQGRQMVMRQNQPAPNPAMHQGMPFPSNVMQQQANNAVRRVQSQPQMGLMPPSVAGSMSMGMNPQTGMPGQLRQATQQQQSQQQQHQHQLNQIRMQQQHQQNISADLSMSRNMVASNQAMQVSMGARAPTQVMSSLTHPPGSHSHPGGMQPPLNQTPFPNGPIPSQHPQSSSPRPNATHTASMSMSNPGPSHTPVNRTRMTPDNSNSIPFIYPGSQFPGNNATRGPANSSSSSYPFVSASSPSMQMDISHSSPPGMMHSQGGTPRTSFIPTPAQQQYDMSGVDVYNFGMPPPSVPSRPPSHAANPNPPTPQQTPTPQQQQQHPPQTSHQPPQTQQGQQQQHHDQMNAHPPRPQSQPQRPPSQASAGGGGSSSQLNHTPRSLQPPLPPAGMPSGLTATGRIPHQGGQSHHQGQQGQHQAIAPRPPASMGMGMNGMGAGQPPRPGSAATSATIASAPGQGSGSQTASSSSGGSPPTNSSIGRPPAASGQMMPSGAGQGSAGHGQGLTRLLQFSGILASESKTQKLQLSWWSDMIKEYFTPDAIMKVTLWKDNQRNEAKPFEIGVPILPRFFLVTTQSGVKSMTLSLDGARERGFGQGHSVVECVAAVWTYKYTNGYTVTLRGPLTCHVIIAATHPPGGSGNAQGPQYTYKFQNFQFDANFHDKFIALDAILGPRTVEPPKTPRNAATPNPIGPPGQSSQQQQQQAQAEEDRKWEEPRVLIEHGSIPGEPVNAFGIPQATMRCLELAESVSAMAELITFANDTKAGPLDALKHFAQKLRDSGAIPPPPPPQQQHQLQQPPQLPPHQMTNSLHPFPNYQPPPSSVSSGTLYSSASPSITHPHPPGPPSSRSSPQNTSSSTNSPEKHPKTIPQQGQTPSGAASSPATTTNTPAMSNASLKRKQAGDASSPTIANPDQPPPKRVPGRKRGRTGGAGAG